MQASNEDATKDAGQVQQNDIGLRALAVKLQAAVKSDKMTEKEAIAAYQEALANTNE